MRGCLTLIVILGSVGVAFAMIGASFVYCLALAIIWLVCVGVSKVFAKDTESEDEDE